MVGRGGGPGFRGRGEFRGGPPRGRGGPRMGPGPPGSNQMGPNGGMGGPPGVNQMGSNGGMGGPMGPGSGAGPGYRGRGAPRGMYRGRGGPPPQGRGPPPPPNNFYPADPNRMGNNYPADPNRMGNSSYVEAMTGRKSLDRGRPSMENRSARQSFEGRSARQSFERNARPNFEQQPPMPQDFAYTRQEYAQNPAYPQEYDRPLQMPVEPRGIPADAGFIIPSRSHTPEEQERYEMDAGADNNHLAPPGVGMAIGHAPDPNRTPSPGLISPTSVYSDQYVLIY